MLTLTCTTGLVHAQSYGTLLGTVVDSQTGESLPGANIIVEGTSYGTATSIDGTYLLPRVPAGELTITVSYVGYTPHTAQVTIIPDVATQYNAALAYVTIPGQELVVVGARAQGQAMALTQQKNAPNISNIIAADQIGRFPDASAPDALQRIPAIGVQRDQGEGRFIQIRGASPQLTTVSFNGERIPSPEGDVRQIALDAIPTELLESIEVSKAITPNMDADAIGGAVNLITRRAPEQTLLAADFAGGLSPIRDQGSMKGSATIGTRSSNGKLGVLVNGALNHRNFGSDNIEPAYDFGDDEAPLGGDDALEEIGVRYYSILRQRLGLNGALDYQLSSGSSLYLRGIFTQLKDEEQRQQVVHIIEDGELEYLHKARTEKLQTFNLSAGGEHLLSRGIQLDYHATFTRSSEDTPNDNELGWVQEDVSFDVSMDDPDAIRVTPQGDALNNVSAFEFNELETESGYTKNTDYIGALNLTFPFELGAQATGSFKIGGKYRYKDKTQDVTLRAFELSDDGDDIFLSDGFGRSFSDVFDVDRFEPGPYPLPARITDEDDVLNFNSRFNGSLEEDDGAAFEGDLEDYTASEQTVAAYAMTTLNLTPRLMVLPGVRYERTTLESTGFESEVEVEVEDDEVSTDIVGIREVQAENDYGYFFPMLHVRYRATENTNIRAAFTTALARPNFFDLAPYRIQDDDEVFIGNPDLDPSRSANFDLLVEHFMSSIGIVSAGVFYKQVQDPIVIFRQDVEENGVELEVSQARNGKSGYIWGIELAAQRQLRSLPGVLSGLGLYGNYTFTQSEATLFDGSTSVFPGQAEHIFNVAVSYERGKFSSQLSLNYTGGFLEEYGDDGITPDRNTDIFVQERVGLDFSGSYNVSSGISVFVELLNLLNEPLELYQGNAARPIQREYYQRWGWIGVRYSR